MHIIDTSIPFYLILIIPFRPSIHPFDLLYQSFLVGYSWSLPPIFISLFRSHSQSLFTFLIYFTRFLICVICSHILLFDF